MSRIDLEAFADRETARVFLASNVSEAEFVEALFTREGIDFAVSVEPFVSGGGLLTSFERAGVAFYVLAGQAAYCRATLIGQGFIGGVLDEHDGG